jgi:hypothetical protein
MPKINIGGTVIKNIKLGETQIKEVYSGSNLIWRGFHPFVEGYSTAVLPVCGQGATITMPVYQWETPPGEYFDYYIDVRTGEEYYPGDQITFPEDVDVLSYIPDSFPDSDYVYHFVASYSSNPGGASTDSYYRINVTGVNGVWADGNGYNVYTETRQVNGSSTTSTKVTIPFFTSGLAGFSYNGMSFRAVGIMENPEGSYPDEIGTTGMISSGNIVTNYTLAKNAIVIREFFVVYAGSDGSYYFFD